MPHLNDLLISSMKLHVKLSTVIVSLLTGISPLQAQNLSETYELALQNAPVLKQAQAKQSAISQVAALKATVISATSALEATEAGFGAGTRTMVDVLNEQRNLYRAKRDFARTRYDYLINSIKLKQAAGSLSQDDIEQVNRLLVANTGGKQSE